MQVSATDLQSAYDEFYTAFNPRPLIPHGPLSETQKAAIHHFTTTLHKGTEGMSSPDLIMIKKH